MTTATDSRPGFQPPRVAAPKTVKGRKAGRGFLAVAIAFVALMILIVLGVVVLARGGELVLAVAKPVGYGVKIQESDLVTVRLTADSSLSPIPASDKGSVVGKYPTMPLAAGSLITRAQVGDKAIPDSKQIVSITLKAEQSPANPLTVDSPVLLVRTPDGMASAAAQAAPLPPVAGTVRGVRTLDYGAGNVVDVLVDAEDGPPVAIAAASGHVTLVVTAGPGR